MAATATKPKRQRRPMTQPPAMAPVVQPPTKFAHLDGEALYEALTTDDEQWDAARAIAESGRSEGRFRAWMNNFYTWKRDVEAAIAAGETPPQPDDRTMIAPDGYTGRSPWWTAGRMREWFIKVGIMDRRGVARKHKPSGRRPGVSDSSPRKKRPAVMRSVAAQILARAEGLMAGGATLKATKTALAAELGVSERAVSRRLTEGRKQRGDTSALFNLAGLDKAEQVQRITELRNMLMADGRRKHEDPARAEIAERTGWERAHVDDALDIPGVVLGAGTEAEQAELARRLMERLTRDQQPPATDGNGPGQTEQT